MGYKQQLIRELEKLPPDKRWVLGRSSRSSWRNWPGRSPSTAADYIPRANPCPGRDPRAFRRGCRRVGHGRLGDPGAPAGPMGLSWSALESDLALGFLTGSGPGPEVFPRRSSRRGRRGN